MNKYKVLIIGGNSRLAKSFEINFIKHKISYLKIMRSDFNYIHNKKKLNKLCILHDFQFIINLSAIASYKKCDLNKSEAYLVNSLFPFQLKKICEKIKINLIHISTDAVFSNLNNCELNNINKIPNPKTILGSSKLLGELLISNSKNCLVLRLPMVYGEHIRNGYVYDNYIKLKNKKSVNASKKVFCSPTNFKIVLSYVTELILNKKIRIFEFSKEIIHLSDNFRISRYDLLYTIATMLNKKKYLSILNANKKFNLNIIANLGLKSSLTNKISRLDFTYLKN